MRFLVAGAIIMLALTPVGTPAATLDDNAQRAIDNFDIERAFISDKQMFVPFHVKETQPLAFALETGKVSGDMRLLVFERADGVVSFLVQQLAYHHIAQMSVQQAMAAYPNLHVAMSDRELRANRWSPLVAEVPDLMPIFTKTIEQQDTRRETMDIGLGVWTNSSQRFYPIENMGDDRTVFDTLDGRQLLVLIDPTSSTPVAFFVDAKSGKWAGDALELDDGTIIRNGLAYKASGERVDIERPLQQFTRWYGFALSFPDCAVYAERD